MCRCPTGRRYRSPRRAAPGTSGVSAPPRYSSRAATPRQPSLCWDTGTPSRSRAPSAAVGPLRIGLANAACTLRWPRLPQSWWFQAVRAHIALNFTEVQENSVGIASLSGLLVRTVYRPVGSCLTFLSSLCLVHILVKPWSCGELDLPVVTFRAFDSTVVGCGCSSCFNFRGIKVQESSRRAHWTDLGILLL